MNPAHTLLPPLFTVPNVQQRLTAERPIQVYTYVFPRTEQTRREELRPIIGTLYPFQDIPALPPHDHEHHEIAIVVDGTAIHQTESSTGEIGPGHVIAVAPGEVHGFYRINDLHLINCTYLIEWLLDDLGELLGEEGLVPLFLHTALFSKVHRFRVPEWHADRSLVHACLRDLEDVAAERQRDKPGRLFMKWCLKKVMVRLHRAFMASGENTHLVAFDPLIQTALERIEYHVSQCLTFKVASLAGQLHLSADYFSRVFREATGWSPMDYYQRRRVQQACSLLLDDTLTATEIAHMLSYCDAAHFCHMFRRYRGVTPTEFRSRYNVARQS